MDYIYYTDGSCRANGQTNAIGAYGFIRVGDDNFECVRTDFNTTNQRCELKAILAACEDAEKYEFDPFDAVKIYSDSAYAINCYNQNWYQKWRRNGWVNSKNEPVANKDLWEQLIPYFEKYNYYFYKTKGHVNDGGYNDKIDALVQKASMEAKND